MPRIRPDSLPPPEYYIEKQGNSGYVGPFNMLSQAQVSLLLYPGSRLIEAHEVDGAMFRLQLLGIKTGTRVDPNELQWKDVKDPRLKGIIERLMGGGLP